MAGEVPSLSEIESKVVDPQLGSGQPAVVYDDSQLLNILNQNAQIKAQNDWNRYNRFLTDLQENYKNQQAIADKEVADSDREYFKKRSIEIFSKALDNPTAIYNPEFQNEVAKLRADATSSKAARDFAEKNAQFIVTSPQFNTESNKQKIDDFINKQTVEGGGRKMFLLDAPDVFDIEGHFKTLMEDPRNKTTENVNWIDPKAALRYDRSDVKYLRDPFLKSAEASYDNVPQIQRKAQELFNDLPEPLKRQIGTPKQLWGQLAAKYFGSDTDFTREGELNVDSYNAPLEREKLAQSERESKRSAQTQITVAGVKTGGKDKVEIPFNPYESIKQALGGANKLVNLSNLPVAQVLAIEPDAMVLEQGQWSLKPEYKNAQISIGNISEDGKEPEGVLIYKKGWKPNEKPIYRSPERVKTAASGYLVQYGKELKGQDAYPYQTNISGGSNVLNDDQFNEFLRKNNLIK